MKCQINLEAGLCSRISKTPFIIWPSWHKTQKFLDHGNDQTVNANKVQSLYPLDQCVTEVMWNWFITYLCRPLPEQVWLDSSSLLPQSFAPSQSHLLGIQRLFWHLNWSSGQLWLTVMWGKEVQFKL